jgi:hypothetical protein
MVILAGFYGLRKFATHTLTEACHDRPYDIPVTKCECMAAAMSQRLISLGGLYRRFSEQPQFSPDELRELRQSCGVPLS